MIQLNPIHVKEVTHELENNYNIIILYLYFYNIILYNYNYVYNYIIYIVRVLSPISGSLVWVSHIRRRSPQSIWLCNTTVLDNRNPKGLGETEKSLLECAHKIS